MSEYLIQGETLTAIGNAIRAKTGGTAQLTPAQMATEIAGIQTGTSIRNIVFKPFYIDSNGEIKINMTAFAELYNYGCASDNTSYLPLKVYIFPINGELSAPEVGELDVYLMGAIAWTVNFTSRTAQDGFGYKEGTITYNKTASLWRSALVGAGESASSYVSIACFDLNNTQITLNAEQYMICIDE